MPSSGPHTVRSSGANRIRPSSSTEVPSSVPFANPSDVDIDDDFTETAQAGGSQPIKDRASSPAHLFMEVSPRSPDASPPPDGPR